MVTITSCRDNFEAEVVKGMLAANGIECYLQNEIMSQVYGGIQAMEINVMVLEEDAEKARELLAARDAADQSQKEKERVEEYHLPPEPKPKSVKQILLQSLFNTAFMAGLFLLLDWTFRSLEPTKMYILYALGFFIVYFSIMLWYYRFRKAKK